MSLKIHIWQFRNDTRNYCAYVQIGDSLETIRYKIRMKLEKNDTWTRVICPYASDPTTTTPYTTLFFVNPQGVEKKYRSLEELVLRENPTKIDPLFNGIIFSSHDE